MFAYLLIGIELVILVGVFYHVFVREPKPFQIGSSGMWGSYEAGGMHFSQSDLDTLVLEYKQNAENQMLLNNRVPRFANSQMMPTFASENADTSHGTGSGSGSLMPTDAGWNSLYASNTALDVRQTEQYGWVQHVDTKPNNAFIGFMYAALCWFENLSVKLP